MATGKSTLGSALARSCSLRYIDLDETVEREAGRKISDIFYTEGEAEFRRLEALALRRAAVPGAVVACGGGTPCHGDNMEFMLGTGLVVCLEASPDTIVRRLLEAPRGKRPLVDGFRDNPDALLRHICDMQNSRYRHYSRAHASFDGNRLEDAAQIALAVEKFSNKFLKS